MVNYTSFLFLWQAAILAEFCFLSKIQVQFIIHKYFFLFILLILFILFDFCYFLILSGYDTIAWHGKEEAHEIFSGPPAARLV